MSELILLGASVRAVAFSALRAGLRPWCVDLFADADLACRCLCKKILSHQYPHGFAEILGQGPNAPFLYTGGLENHPDLIDQLAQIRPLWGNSGGTLRPVRCPFRLSETLAKHDIPFPPVSASPPQGVGRWLIKPYRSAGGNGVRFWEGRDFVPSEKTHYFQAFLPGPTFSGIFLGRDKKAALLGVTRQLVGETWLSAQPFQYCGNVGPLFLDGATEQQFYHLGNVLVQEFGLNGLFGVDCLLHEGKVVPLEVNPRYPASSEVIEYTTGFSLLSCHARIFQEMEPLLPESVPRQKSVIGKAILYAPIDFRFPEEGPWLSSLSSSWNPWSLPEFADIPQGGSSMQRRQPVFTVFASAPSEGECLEQLKRTAFFLDKAKAAE